MRAQHPATTAPAAPAADEHRAARVLGVGPGASTDELRAAYRRQARALHPDRFHHLGPDAVDRATARFREVVRAYRVLAAAAAHRPTITLVDGLYRPRHRSAAAAYAPSDTVGTRYDAAA
ncbi:J domain-containing protein [Nocardioides sp. SYSU DS0663]|uniref:J domain-containing protein n=1 Tax=Nocardioides sp. SYSU DS0663 TaxID=3416445 RepID=UPI003F4B6858